MMSQHSVPIIGIVGGVGSGKSTLAAWLADRVRVAVLDADGAGHEALRNDRVKTMLQDTLGSDVFRPDGEVDRRRVAARVFGVSPEHAADREQLEQIVHPVIRQNLQREVEALRSAGSVDVIVLDAAVMLESGWSELCDAILFVDTPRTVRLQRVRDGRGWSEEELDRREASQWPIARKRDAADVVIDNSRGIDHAGLQLLDFLQRRFPSIPTTSTGDALASAGAERLLSRP